MKSKLISEYNYLYEVRKKTTSKQNNNNEQTKQKHQTKNYIDEKTRSLSFWSYDFYSLF